MNEDTTLGDKKDDTSPSVAPTDIKVPVTESEPTPSDKTLKPDTEPEATTTVKPGSGDEPQPPKGRAAQRIGDLIRENKSLRGQLEGTADEETTTETAVPETVPTTPVAGDTPEIERARSFLKTLGYAPESEIKQTVKDEIEGMEARMILDSEKMRLEQAFDGSDGRPRYEHEKVMDHARDTGIYNPEAAYENLYKAEITDWVIKNAQEGADSTFVEKPSSSSAPETGQLTRESLARILSTPDGRKWYDANREKVLSALSKGDL